MWLRAAGWWASDYAYAVTRQARAVVATTTPLTMRSGERAPVLVIPGIYESWKFLLPLVAQAHERGHPIHVVEPLGPNVRPVIESAEHVAEYLERNDLSGVLFLAHSKGGLIGKHVMIQPEGQRRVHGMVAVATPFKGSDYARFMIAPSLRIFSPEDATIRALEAEAAVNARIVSIYGSFDPHIPSGSELAGAKNVRLDTGGHFRILEHPRILAELELLAETAEMGKGLPPEFPRAEGPSQSG